MIGGEGFLHLFEEKGRAEPDRLFARFNGAPLSFGDLGRKADSFAAGLRRRGIVRGDRVAAMLRNSAAAIATILGLARAGVVWVPVNVQQRGPGLKYIIEHSEPRLIVADADLVGTIRDCGTALEDVGIITHREGAGEELDRLLETDARFDEGIPPPTASLAICYTSGTTGNPKGVLLSHAMLRFAGEGVALVSAARENDVFLMWEPLYHIGGMQLLVLPLIRNITIAMVDRFSAGRFWHDARAYGASHIHYLGGILQILLKQPPNAFDRAHGVRIAWGGGCPKDVWRPFEERFGVQIRECYGMTEASSITTFNDSGLVGSVGRPVPWFSLELRNERDQLVHAGERGEIVVRARSDSALFVGYFRDPEATAKAIRGAMLYTGDLGVLDSEGNLTFLGRMTDSVRCKGENVSAWEVERVVVEHPAVEDCAIIGVAAEVGEQEMKLFVKPKSGEEVDPPVLSAWLGRRLAPYQNPRYIAVVSEFERTPSQRIMKHRLSRATSDCWDRLA
ncbi:MAG TPA: AMP-binding protein [Stellaceae bacterium]|nr:AMP-binding protein [Stellaceae bacterium]